MLKTATKSLVLSPAAASLSLRACAVALILFLDKSFLNLFVDFAIAQHAEGAAAVVRDIQHFGLRFLVTAALAVALLTYVRVNPPLVEVDDRARTSRVSYRLLALHILLILAQAPVLANLYQGSGPTPLFLEYIATCLLLSVVGFVVLLAAAAPLALWASAARALGSTWLYGLTAALSATLAIQWSQALWQPTAFVTFRLVQWVLAPFIASLQAHPADLILATDQFAVQVSDICSGLEGIGLMLAFCGAWLLRFRAEYRFPHALLLIPAGIVVIFVLNVLRIAALVLIGHLGYPEVAEIGFHSQAGWIAFNAAACSIVVASRYSSWISRPQRDAAPDRGDNPAAAYLLPFLGLLLGGMLARALSAGFELFYSFRIVLALWGLIACFSQLRTVQWRFTWRGPAAGLSVLALWLVGAHLLVAPQSAPEALLALPRNTQLLWLTGRTLTAVLLVPVAEELAFRGFLMRRLVSVDFSSVEYRAVGALPLIASSVAFGMGHAHMLVPGIAAGIVYGIVVIRTGRLGEAIAAHAVTNLGLAFCVLSFGQWQLW